MAAQLWAWLALGTALAAVASGRRRFELVSLGALLALGLAGVAPPAELFSGFAHPALVTIVSLYVVSQGLIESGALGGLGRAIEGRVHGLPAQILGLAGVTALLSAFMNNVGALALVLPTAVRMARRSRVPAGRFGLPLAFAAVLGGTLTLTGSAPNVIVSGFRSTAFGQPFRMFDFLPHGAAICLVGAALWLLGARSGGSGEEEPGESAGGDAGQGKAKAPPSADLAIEQATEFAPLGTPRRRLCLLILAAAVGAVSVGLLPPSLGFGTTAVAMVLAGVLEPAAAYAAIDLRVVVFLGSMLGLGRVLDQTGALAALVLLLEPAAAGLGRLALLGLVFAASCTLGNLLNNAAAAVVMSPVALSIAETSTVAGVDALLMTVAAGACLALVLPTHQVTLMAYSQAPFAMGRLRRWGLLLTLLAGGAAVLAVSAVWP